MAIEFTKLSEVEALTEVPEGATVLAEVDGAIKRIPGEGLGGAAAVPMFNMVTAEAVTVETLGSAAPAMSFTCNMTFDEIVEQYNAMTLGQATMAGVGVGIMYASCVNCFAYDSAGEECLPSSYTGTTYEAYAIAFFMAVDSETMPIYYLSDGTITMTAPFGK